VVPYYFNLEDLQNDMKNLNLYDNNNNNNKSSMLSFQALYNKMLLSLKGNNKNKITTPNEV
jgi:hypothetical protein